MSVTSVREGGPILKGPWNFKDSPINRVAELSLGAFPQFTGYQDVHPLNN
jgi:hypothetical protein